MALEHLGWREDFATSFEPFHTQGLQAGRVVIQHRDLYHLLTADGEVEGIVTGRFRHTTSSPADFPAVGDWVAFGSTEYDGPVSIQAVLPRRSKFSRLAAGTTPYEQVIATNVDTVFIVSGLDDNHKLRRIERYATQVWQSGAIPVVLLNKVDLCPDPESVLCEAQLALPGVDVLTVSGERGDGIDGLTRYLAPGQTVALVGSSGVGKSTLINFVLGHQQMATHDVRDGDSRGRHTTTHRELIQAPGGAMLIDTPGMREFALWTEHDDGDAGEADSSDTFEDIAELARRCRFPNCRHMDDVGCQVQPAVQAGELDYARVRSYRALAREMTAATTKKKAGRSRPDADTKRRAQRADRRSGKRLLRDEEEEF
jgi:ribosome biogenesis GTPase / thiamine phosphate phosphatase